MMIDFLLGFFTALALISFLKARRKIKEREIIEAIFGTDSIEEALENIFDDEDGTEEKLKEKFGDEANISVKVYKIDKDEDHCE